MTKQNELLLSALKAAIHGEKVNWSEEISASEWLAFFKLAETQKVLPMVYDAVYSCPVVDPAVVQGYKPVIRQQIMIQVLKTAEFQSLYQRLFAADVRPLVVKGLVCRNIYQNPDARTSGDEDILIPREQFETAHQAMLDFGMSLLEPEKDIYETYEVPYGKQGNPIHIELHKSLFPPEQEAYGELNRYFEGIHERALPITIQGTEFWMPDYTDHLFYLICHAFKHFLHSGFGIRQVCDICLFAERYNSQIDWETIKKNCAEIRADQFTAAVFNIGAKHLGISAPNGWDDVDETALLEDLLSGGIYGAADMSRLHSSTITLNAVAADKQGKKSSVWKSAFPAAKDLKSRYPYLGRHPVLLPIAWADRLLKYCKETKNAEGNNTAETLKIGQQRVELLRKYGIIK